MAKKTLLSVLKVEEPISYREFVAALIEIGFDFSKLSKQELRRITKGLAEEWKDID